METLLTDKLQRGEKLFTSGDLTAAETIFREILENDKSNQQAWNNLGVIAFKNCSHPLKRETHPAIKTTTGFSGLESGGEKSITLI